MDERSGKRVSADFQRQPERTSMFKEPRTRSEAISRRQQRDELIAAARVLDHCKVEPAMAGALRRLAEQMDNAIHAGGFP